MCSLIGTILRVELMLSIQLNTVTHICAGLQDETVCLKFNNIEHKYQSKRFNCDMCNAKRKYVVQSVICKNCHDLYIDLIIDKPLYLYLWFNVFVGTYEAIQFAI